MTNEDIIRMAQQTGYDKLSEQHRLGLEASIQRVTVAMQKTTIASLTQQRAELVRACRQALQAIEQGAPFDHLDNVVAPELRRATEGIDE